MNVFIKILILATTLCGFVELKEIKSNDTHFIPTKEWQEIKTGRTFLNRSKISSNSRIFLNFRTKGSGRLALQSQPHVGDQGSKNP